MLAKKEFLVIHHMLFLGLYGFYTFVPACVQEHDFASGSVTLLPEKTDSIATHSVEKAHVVRGTVEPEIPFFSWPAELFIYLEFWRYERDIKTILTYNKSSHQQAGVHVTYQCVFFKFFLTCRQLHFPFFFYSHLTRGPS